MSAPVVTVRPIRVADVAAFRDALDEVARERRYLALLQAPPIERVRTFVSDNVANDVAQFVAVEDAGRVLGWADILPAAPHAMRHVGTLGMGVRASHRGQGLGRRLLRACIDHAGSRGIARIELTARADNLAAIALYEALGFRFECRKEDGLRFDGVSSDTVQMSLLRTAVA